MITPDVLARFLLRALAIGVLAIVVHRVVVSAFGPMFDV